MNFSFSPYSFKLYNKELSVFERFAVISKLLFHKFYTRKINFSLLNGYKFVFFSNTFELSLTTTLNYTKELRNLLSISKKQSKKLVLHISNFHYEKNVIKTAELLESFSKVVKLYHEMPLPRYSRYENWKRSCYMEVHEKWTPKTEVNTELAKSLENILEKGKERFRRWYSFKNNLAQVDVITMNSFVTKYIPKPGENEFGKHVDGVKIDGSLILALPEEIDLTKKGIKWINNEGIVKERHNWKGLVVWDTPRDKILKTKLKKQGKDQHKLKLNPGDGCFLEKMIWHHGLPIETGARYVIVCFYQCIWKKVNY